MQVPIAGAIDCDVHPAMPGVTALLPYLDDYWRDQISNRHIDKLPFQLSSYPPTSPLSARPDWRPAPGAPGRQLGADPPRHVLDPLRAGLRRSATRCTAPWRCSITTWRRPCARPSTTGWPGSCWTPSRVCAPRSWCRPHDVELAAARDRARGARPALRAGAAAGHGRGAARPPLQLADLRGRREARAGRSASTPAAPIGMRRPTPAGPPTGSRTTSPSPAPSRRSC